MRTIFVYFFIIALFFFAAPVFGFTSSIDNPHWIKIVSISEKELPGCEIVIYFSEGSSMQGTVESVSHSDLKLKTSNGEFIIILTSVKFIEILNKPPKSKK